MIPNRVLIFLAVLSLGARGQSFNVDLDFGGASSPPSGGPASTYGAAAGQPGFWNLVGSNVLGLTNTLGAPTGAALLIPGGGMGSTWQVAGVTGDFEKLIGDYWSGQSAYTFTGLIPGKYRVYTYAYVSGNPVLLTTVSVSGSPDPQQSVGGASITAPNTFTLGITHAIHDVVVSPTGTIFIQVMGVTSSAHVNGFQLVACPTGFAATLTQASIASLQISFTCGKPGWYYLLGATWVHGAFPSGPFFGIEYDPALINFEIASGPPLFGTLDSHGNAFGSLPGPVPSNLTIYLVGLEANSDASTVIATAPFSYTTL
jgi:hypothetical protein